MKKILMLLFIAATAVSCSKNDSKPTYAIDVASVNLNYDKSHQFVVKLGNTVVDNRTLTWFSSDETVGTVDASGLFIANRIGKTTVKAEINGNSLTSEVVVNPYSSLCKEPILDFGASITAIKSKETRTLNGENATLLRFAGENAKLRDVRYFFDVTGLKHAMLLITETNAVVEESAKFLSERYDFLGEDDDIYVFGDKNVLIGVSVQPDLGFNFLYLKNTSGVTGKSAVQMIQKTYKGEPQPLTLKYLN
jgi:hypothetical protein